MLPNKMVIRSIFAASLLLLTYSALPAQTWPDKIRGYKVQRTDVRVDSLRKDKADAEEGEALVSIRDLRLSIESLFSVSVEAGVEVTANVNSGRIDLITFRDIRVNGVAVDVAEYDTPFDLKRNDLVRLPDPVRGSIRMTGIALAAYRELIETKEEWDVTGTVFVFGRFRKFGFGFKRVIPIHVEMKIDNPLLSPK